MPTQPLLALMDGPDGIGSTVGSQMEISDSSLSIKGTNTISHTTLQEKCLMQGEGDMPVDCMFCDKIFKHHEELGKHVLSQHRPTLCEPAVLRVEAEYLSPLDKRKKNAVTSIKEDVEDEDFDCEVCGQTFDESIDLDTHMKKHKDSFTYWCNVCGRRFKEPWFLKNHMRTHTGKSGGKHKLQPGSEMPGTINEVAQELVKNVTSPYKMCMVCGFLFSNKESLMEHSKIHMKDSTASGDNVKVMEVAEPPRENFMHFLNLKPCPPTIKKTEISGKWIGELDPFNTYQAWQLATKGKVAVGYGQVKEYWHEVSTDNDDSCSDKEELAEIWNTEKISLVCNTDQIGKSKSSSKNENCVEISLSQDKENIKHTSLEVPYLDLEQNVSNGKDKPTLCNDCGKTFKTYHQLVLHSRVHKKDRDESESPTMSGSEGRQSTSVSPDITAHLEDRGFTDKAEDGSEDGGAGGDAAQTDKNDDGQERMKVKGLTSSRECSYCGKSFRSNYYLNIHLRTHTAAQKTSLRYHLERHHKDKPCDSNAPVKNSKRLLVQRSGNRSPAINDHVKETKSSKRLMNNTKDADCPPIKQQKGVSSFRDILGNTKHSLLNKEAKKIRREKDKNILNEIEEQVMTPFKPLLKEDAYLDFEENVDQGTNTFTDVSCVDEDDGLILCKPESNVHIEGMPLNLSLKAAMDYSATPITSVLFATSTCPFCTYKTFYPEVLIMHQKLVHKYNPDLSQKNGCRIKTGVSTAKTRRTGCPPSLLGKDVTPMFSNCIKSKVATSTQSKTLYTEKAKQAPVLPNKSFPSGSDSKSLDQGNIKLHRRQNGAAQMGSYRHLQPDLQGMSHLLDRMPKPEQKVKSLNGPSTSSNFSTHGHIEYPYQSLPPWPSEHSFNRTVNNMNLDFGEQSSQSIMHNMMSLDTANYLARADVARIHLPRKNASMLPQEISPSKSGTSLLPNNGLNPHEVDPRWNVLIKSYEHHAAEPLYKVYGSSSNRGYSSSMEVRRPTSYRHLSNGLLSKRGYESLVGNVNYGPNDRA
ncbi:hypothetical protein FKM82_007637 [Ascaphus truei]